MTQQRSRAVPREEAGKVACLLCGGLISVSGGDRARFVDHMSNEHDAKTDCHDLLLAACVLDPREKLFLVKSTATRLDTIGKGRAPNYSDNFVDKMTNSGSSSAPASKPASNPPPASVVRRGGRVVTPVQHRQASTLGRRVVTPAHKQTQRPAAASAASARGPASSFLQGNSSISVSKVDSRRKCNMCAIVLPSPAALIQHMNRNHFNLPGGVNIIGEAPSSSFSQRPPATPSYSRPPAAAASRGISPKVQRLVTNLRAGVPSANKVDKSRIPLQKQSQVISKNSALRNSSIVLKKVENTAPAQTVQVTKISGSDEILLMDEDGGQEVVTNSDYECDICNKKLASDEALKLHKNAEHGEENVPVDSAQEALKGEIDNLETSELLDNLVNFLET